MERVQTAFRLDAALVMRLKRRARAEKKSLNKLVEDVLLKESPAELQWPKVIIPAEPDPFLESLMVQHLNFTKEDIEADPKLEYLLGKL